MLSSKSKVYFFYETPLTLHKRTGLKKFITYLIKNEGRKLQYLNYIFCTDQQLLQLNKQYLKHNYYTDIISFDLSENNLLAAEIYISIDRVKENAGQLKLPLKTELQRVMFHGALHLCGYRDKTRADQKEMREKENFYIQKYNDPFHVKHF